MTFQAVATFLSTAIAIYCIIPYVIAILKGKTKPHQLSWLIFVIMNSMVLLSQYLEGARGSVLITLTFFIGSLLVFMLSFKYGTRHTSKWDKALFTFAIVAIIVWALTKSNATAIWLTLFIDLAASTMLILKVRAQPSSEDPLPWALGALAYVFTNLSLIGTSFGILYVRPLYGLLCDAGIVVAILFYRKRAQVVHQTSPAEI